jgi:hypothetical protein
MANSVRFYLGTHEPHWLRSDQFADVPLFVSAIRLRKKPVRSPAFGSWALDSGGFSELSQHGRWTVGPEQYADETRRWAAWTGPQSKIGCASRLSLKRQD